MKTFWFSGIFFRKIPPRASELCTRSHSTEHFGLGFGLELQRRNLVRAPGDDDLNPFGANHLIIMDNRRIPRVNSL
jgi:hypothetical protein